MYTQCKLKYHESGLQGVAWIPTDKAKKNLHVRVGDSKSELMDATVLEVYGTTEVDMPRHQLDYKKASPENRYAAKTRPVNKMRISVLP